MALRPTCDVYGTAKGVKKYEISVFELDEDRKRAPVPAILYSSPDLCPRALERLKAKIITGTTPPRKSWPKDERGLVVVDEPKQENQS